jgi:hypothetical protein
MRHLALLSWRRAIKCAIRSALAARPPARPPARVPAPAPRGRGGAAARARDSDRAGAGHRVDRNPARALGDQLMIRHVTIAARIANRLSIIVTPAAPTVFPALRDWQRACELGAGQWDWGSQLWGTTSRSTPPLPTTALGALAVEKRPEVRSKPNTGRAEARPGTAEPSQELTWALPVSLTPG